MRWREKKMYTASGMPPTPVPPDLGSAREQFLSIVGEVRPELHRYCARLVGSAIDGEDVVQDSLAKAFYALSQSPELPPLRPWLFRIAHNTAVDFLRRYDRHHVESVGDLDDRGQADEAAPDPETTRAALSRFLALPISQRSAVILKDVLGHSLEECAAHMGTSVMAVKALLSRGRSRLKQGEGREAAEGGGKAVTTPAERALLHGYVSLFNARDWDAVRAMLLEECRLDLVGKSQRQGRAVGEYFSRSARETEVRLVVGRAEGRAAVGVFRGAATRPASIVLLGFEGAGVALIRDFRYVPYLTAELEFEPTDEP